MGGRTVVLLLALLLVGCHKQTRPAISTDSTPTVIPKECIIGGILNKTKCYEMPNGTDALCDGVVVKFACVKVGKK